MVLDNVISLFELFSGEDADEGWSAVITLAVNNVTAMLRDDADPSDTRLEFLAAAIANFNVQQIHAGSAKSDYNLYGKTRSDGDSSSVKAARSLMKEYFQLCSDLIKPEVFVFKAI
jgi:hypothetical protein